MTDDLTDTDTICEVADLKPWSELNGIEQSLVRCGLRKKPAAGTIQAHGMALRWAGMPGAPLTGGYTPIEQRELVPEFAGAAAGLITRGVLSLRRNSASYPQDSDYAVPSGDVDHVLHDPATWIWDTQQPSRHWLDVPQPAHAHWYHSAYFAVARTDYPKWRELSESQRAILVSAQEASGMLTGHLGIWSQPDPTLTPSQRLAAIDEILAPLLPLVRDNLLEVHHRTDARTA